MTLYRICRQKWIPIRKARILFVFTFVVLTVLWLHHIPTRDENVNYSMKIEGCPIPDFAEITSHRNFVHSEQNLNCPHHKKVVKVWNGRVFIKKDSNCKYQCIEWNSDFVTNVNLPLPLINGSKLPCTFFLITCYDGISKKSVIDVVTGVERNSKLLERSNCKAAFENLFDILIIGVSGISYNGWKYMLPNTFSTFHNVVHGVSFTKFNTLGDGPTANIHALLTGTKDTEVYESRRRVYFNDYIDDFNWIWRHLKRKGYITSFIEDATKFGTFQYRLRGFKKQPTDFYLRTMLLAVDHLINKFCFPSTSLHEAIFNFQRQIDEVYSEVPKFSFIQFTRYSSHDNLQFLDRDLSKFIAESKEKNPNLFLILYADDGQFIARKSSMVDKYEVRLPFMGISLPISLEEKRTVLERNSKILTSSFDLHATIEDLIGIHKPINGSRHMSLLLPLSENRSCKDIDVSPHWCSCFNAKHIQTPLNYLQMLHLALRAVRIISDKTQFLRDLCESLRLDHISDFYELAPSSSVLKFKKSADPDGYIPDMSDSTTQDIFWYRMAIKTQPGNMLFSIFIVSKVDQSLKREVFSKFQFSSKDIVRLNYNHKLTRCISSGLKKNKSLFLKAKDFCFCKDTYNFF